MIFLYPLAKNFSKLSTKTTKSSESDNLYQSGRLRIRNTASGKEFPKRYGTGTFVLLPNPSRSKREIKVSGGTEVLTCLLRLYLHWSRFPHLGQSVNPSGLVVVIVSLAKTSRGSAPSLSPFRFSRGQILNTAKCGDSLAPDGRRVI